MNSQPLQQQQYQMTPFVAPVSEDRTQYGNSYYNNYGFSTGQAPPRPEQQAWNNGQSPSFGTPPPPTWQQVNQAFGANTNSNSFDLLDNQTTSPVQQENALTRSSYAAPTREAYDNDIPLDIIASQERAMEEAKKRSYNSKRSGSSDGRALAITSTNTLVVPVSNNPVGSDAVHPSRMDWKHNRGGKTIAGATGGAILGGIAFGPAFPVGMVLGGAVGGYATNKISKQGERRAQRKWEQKSVQSGAQKSLTAKSHASVV